MQRKTRFVPVLIRKDESGLKPWLDIERWFQTFTLESAEGGYAERRSPTFVGVPPVASRAGSRPSTFGVVRYRLSAFLSGSIEESFAGKWVEREVA